MGLRNQQRYHPDYTRCKNNYDAGGHPSEERAMLNELLGCVAIEDKATVFDALVREFQGKARFVHKKRRTKEVKTGPHEVKIAFEDYPVYEFILRVDGHDDFAAAILALIKRPNN